MTNPYQSDINAVIARDYTIDISGSLSRGWEILQERLGEFIGFLIVSFFISYALSSVTQGVLQVALTPILISEDFNPLNIVLVSIGTIIAIILPTIVGGPLQAGYYFGAFKICKRQPLQFSDFFKGFQSSYFVPIALATVVITIFSYLCFLPAIGVVTGAIISAGTVDPEALISIAGPIGLLMILVGSIVSFILTTLYLFTIPLIVGRQMQFWPAMEASRKIISKRILSFILLTIVLGFVNLAGFLLCCIGLIFSMPLTVCTLAAVYESVVGLPVSEA